MRIGFGQIIIIIVVVLILFGKFPQIMNNFLNGLKNIKKSLESGSEESIKPDKEDIKKIDDK